MSPLFRSRASLALTAGVFAATIPTTVAAAAADPVGTASGHGHSTEFHQTNLVSNRTDQGAQVIDRNLRNPWGLALGPTTPLWAADNAAGLATVYSVRPGGTMAAKANLTVTIPGGRASTGDGPSPTGQVFNPTTGFEVRSRAGKGPAAFIFGSESGQITAWSPVADPVVAGRSSAQLQFSSPTAVYKGLATATLDGHPYLYATNLHDGTVAVFNSDFRRVQLAGSFRDRALPAGYAPFGIQAIGGFIYVTYALQDGAKHDDVAGAGHGFIDIYTRTGFLVRRLVSGGSLNSPWGLAVAPDGFGKFAGDLLAGNFGDGLIHAYGLFSGKPAGTVRNERGHPIKIDGLWALKVGTATTGGTHSVLFSAGINDEKDGLLGSINRAP